MYTITFEQGFLQYGAGTAKWVENGCFCGVADGYIHHDLCQFGWQHADECVTAWPVTVTAGIGGDVLRAIAFSDKDGAVVGLDNG